MKLHKKLLKNNLIQNLLCYLVALYVKLVYATSRKTIIGKENLQKLIGNNKGFIFAFWHGRLLMMPCFKPKNRHIDAMISLHNDGELIAKVIPHFGLKLIRGSKKEGGMKVLKAALLSLQAGNIVAITPDGPRGPRMKLQGHIISIAKKTGCPILPITYSTNKAVILKSWDRFLIPKPFGKITFIYGKPVYVDGNTSKQQIGKVEKELEIALNTMTKEIDIKSGLSR